MLYYKAYKFDKFIISAEYLNETEINSLMVGNINYIEDYIKRENSIKYDGLNFYLTEWKEYNVIGLNENINTNDYFYNGYLGLNNTGVILFKNYIGIAKFRDIIFEVTSLKIEKKAFEDKLFYIENRLHSMISLTYEYHGVSRSKFKNTSEKYSGFFKYQKLYNSLKDNKITKHINYIIFNNNYAIKTKNDRQNINKIKTINYLNIKDITSGKNQPKYKYNINEEFVTDYLPQYLTKYNKIISIDTNENQFVKFFIRYAIGLLNDYIKETETFIENSFFIKSQYLYMQNERNKLNKLLNNSFFQNISNLNTINFSSQVLAKKYGYRQIYQEYLSLNNTPYTNLNSDSLIELFQNKSVDVLYEYIALFELLDSISYVYGETNDFIIPTNFNNYTISISESNTTEFFFKGNETFYDCKLYFQHSFNANNEGSYSIEFIPDFSLQVLDNDNKLYHFDTKFRKSSSNKELNEDINKMHSYRDGIKNTVGSFILYPGSNLIYYSSNTMNQYDGVGAIPLTLDIGKNGDLLVLLKTILRRNIIE